MLHTLNGSKTLDMILCFRGIVPRFLKSTVYSEAGRSRLSDRYGNVLDHRVMGDDTSSPLDIVLRPVGQFLRGY